MEDLNKAVLTSDLKTIKCISWNIKLNKYKKEVLVLFNSSSEANLIFQGYVLQLSLKIMNISSKSVIINNQQINTQEMISIGFEITNYLNYTRYFEEILLISIPQPVILEMPLLKLGNLDVR